MARKYGNDVTLQSENRQLAKGLRKVMYLKYKVII